MPRSSDQKLKLIYLMDILLERTDEEHSLTMNEILDALRACGITAERKSIYSDIEALRQYGLDVIRVKENRTHYYYVASRKFELAELKLLVDSVQSAKFITAKKSNQLIRKIEELGSKYEASQLQRQVYVNRRIKTMNESIFYNVDQVHTAIAENSTIRFQYYRWTPDKKMELRKGGAFYEVSPWALSWDDENYYMVAYDSSQGIIKHFRVDKMLHIDVTGHRRKGQKEFQTFDMAVYARKVFGMFAGKEEKVCIECINDMAGVMLDRFGQDVTFIKEDEEHFRVNVDVAVSRQFIFWVLSLGGGARIVGPPSVVDQIRQEIARLQKQYIEI